MSRLLLGLALVGAGVVLVLVGLVWLPYEPEALSGPALARPSLSHPFGTDWFGRDVLARVMAGGRASWAVALLALAAGGSLGLAVGLGAGFFPGIWTAFLIRLADALLAFPPILLALVLAVLLGPGVAGVALSLALFNFPYFARLAHAGVWELRAREFVLAARAVGATPGRILLRHILPNLASSLLVQATFSLSTSLLAEASLSYLGLGVQPPHPTWGRMLWEAQTWVFRTPWPAVFPGLVLTGSVLGLNLLGDFLRDRWDPRMRRLP